VISLEVLRIRIEANLDLFDEIEKIRKELNNPLIIGGTGGLRRVVIFTPPHTRSFSSGPYTLTHIVGANEEISISFSDPLGNCYGGFLRRGTIVYKEVLLILIKI